MSANNAAPSRRVRDILAVRATCLSLDSAVLCRDDAWEEIE